MGSLTILQARRVIGKEAEVLTDEEIQKEIDSAVLLKDLFFDKVMKVKKSGFNRTNVP